MKKILNILIADTYSVVRFGVSTIIKNNLENVNVLFSGDYAELINTLDEDIDIIFLDTRLAGIEGNFFQILDKVKTRYPEVLVLIFSSYDESQFALRYIHSGANGFLSKNSSENEIIKAVKSLVTTKKYISDVVKDKIYERAIMNTPVNPIETLSDREIEVAELLINGEGNFEISNKLNIQMTTVSTLKNRIFEKLEVKNVIKLVEIFKIHGSGAVLVLFIFYFLSEI